MQLYLPRTCTEIKADGKRGPSEPLEAHRDADAYVLLGDPGAGKTELFKHEAIETGGVFISARDFLVFERKEASIGKTLFIDGLDETRVGKGDRRTPLDRIRTRLDQLDRPRFRLSCREADWLGSSDREALNRVTPIGNVRTLHLDPLTEQQIIAFLEDRLGAGEARIFIQTAHEHQLEGLLNNPQTLKLLTDSLRGQQWPVSRTSTYELACRQLAKETNDEHRAAKRSRTVPIENLLDAAGYLSAIQLLADIPGISLDEADQNNLSLPLLTRSSHLPFEEALETRLFKGLGDERFALVHRSVAEFLAARYLAARVENHGLPLGRVLALMVGIDGGVVAGLRGLHAWLVLHCSTQRYILIENDPLGAVLYGDARSFSTADKQCVLSGLHSQAQKFGGFRWQDWSASPFGALSTPDMLPNFLEILVSPSRQASDQALVECVVDALRHGDPISDLAEPLLMIVRDASRWQAIRKDALYAYGRISNLELARLKELLDDIYTGEVADSDDELLGVLLELLYPKIVTPQRVFDYLHPPKDPNLIGHYLMFWVHGLPKNASNSDLPLLLDGLAGRPTVLAHQKHEHSLREMAGELLARGLEVTGDATSDQQLYTWLGVGLDEYGHPILDRTHHDRIEKWFLTRPDRYKGVLAHCAQECADNDNVRYCLYKCAGLLYGTTVPDDIGLWYLSQVETAKSEALSCQFFEQAVSTLILERGHQGLSLDFIDSWANKRSKYRDALGRMLYCEISDWHLELARHARERKVEQKERKGEWLRYFREHLSVIREGKAHPKVLHDLAAAYFGHYYEARGDTPLERLQNFLNQDEEVIEAALSGFRNSLFRGDLPTEDEIADLETKGRMHYIRLPCLAGAEEISAATAEDILSLDDDVLTRLIWFKYTYGTGDELAWFVVLVRKRPELIAHVLVIYASKAIEAAKEHVSGLYSLAHDDAYAEVARLAVLPLLEVFPVRARKNQLTALESLLKAAICHLDKEDLLPLIGRRLQYDRLDVLQRVYCLACALLVKPAEYQPMLLSCVSKSQARARHLARFFHGSTDMLASAQVSESILAMLIDLFAPICSPERPKEAHWVSPAMQLAELVRAQINHLGGLSSQEAGQELERLLDNPKLVAWHSSLRYALQTQQVSRREALYRHPSADEVEKTLANLQPSSAADLAALTLDYLQELRDWIRHGNTDPYKQFWNLNSYGKPTVPRIEDSCRDTILDKLRVRLGSLGIDAQPEGHYADDNRADIRVSLGGAGGLNVPIEIKRDKHPDLWRAIHQQLIARYTRDPGAAGHGIYLVFWFGGEGMPTPPHGRAKPHSAEELALCLKDLLEPEVKRLISVCVFDVASRA